MTIDISALASMVRRMDVSATLKSFVVVVAVLLVWTNLATIGTALQWGILELFDAAGVASAWVITAVIAALAPLGFIVWDWVARRPWRHLAAVSGALIGGIGFAAVGGALGALAYMGAEELDAESLTEWPALSAAISVVVVVLTGWLITESRRLRALLGWALVAAAVLVLAGFFFLLMERTIEDPETTRDDWVALIGAAVALPVVVWLFVRAVRHRIVLSGDRPRELMLGAIERRSFWARLAFLAGLPSSLWHARAMTRSAFWAFLSARPLVYAGTMLLLGNVDVGLGPTAALALGASAIVGGHLLFHVGKRLAARYIWDPTHLHDPRPPILFLRSFDDDQLRFGRPWWDLAGRWLDLWSFRRNVDEAMIDEIAQYGPVVALGMPGETRVPFGAMRYYSRHEDWQRIVTDTAKRARAIVIGAGSTPGVLWEYGLLARENLVGRTLLLFPPTAGGSAADGAALNAFAAATGTELRPEHSDAGHLIALLTTDAGPTLLTATKPDAAAHVLAVRAHFQRCTAAQLADPLGL